MRRHPSGRLSSQLSTKLNSTASDSSGIVQAATPVADSSDRSFRCLPHSDDNLRPACYPKSILESDDSSASGFSSNSCYASFEDDARTQINTIKARSCVGRRKIKRDHPGSSDTDDLHRPAKSGGGMKLRSMFSLHHRRGRSKRNVSNEFASPLVEPTITRSRIRRKDTYNDINSGEPTLYYHEESNCFYYMGRLVRIGDARPTDLLIINREMKFLRLPDQLRDRVLASDAPCYHDNTLEDSSGVYKGASPEYHWMDPPVYRGVKATAMVQPDVITFSSHIKYGGGTSGAKSRKRSPPSILEGGLTPKSMVITPPYMNSADTQEEESIELLEPPDNALYSHMERDATVFSRGTRLAATSMVEECFIEHYPNAKWGSPVIAPKDQWLFTRMQRGDTVWDSVENHLVVSLSWTMRSERRCHLWRDKSNISTRPNYCDYGSTRSRRMVTCKQGFATVRAMHYRSWLTSPSHIRRSFGSKVQRIMPCSVFVRCLLIGLDPLQGRRVLSSLHSLGEDPKCDEKTISTLMSKSVYDDTQFDNEVIHKLEAVLDGVMSGEGHVWTWNTLRNMGSMILLIQGIVNGDQIDEHEDVLVKDIEWWLLNQDDDHLVESTRFIPEVYFNSRTNQVVITTEDDHRKFHYNVHKLQATPASNNDSALYTWHVVPVD